MTTECGLGDVFDTSPALSVHVLCQLLFAPAVPLTTTAAERVIRRVPVSQLNKPLCWAWPAGTAANVTVTGVDDATSTGSSSWSPDALGRTQMLIPAGAQFGLACAHDDISEQLYCYQAARPRGQAAPILHFGMRIDISFLWLVCLCVLISVCCGAPWSITLEHHA